MTAIREQKTIFDHLAVRAKLIARWVRRSRARELKEVPGRMKRWWSINSLRFSWGLFFVEVGSVIMLLALGILSYLFFSHYVFQPVQVSGSSMYPTLINTDMYWLNRFAYELHDPRPGDIVAIKDPSGHGFDVKRIIAVPKQRVYINWGKVYVDGSLLRESYLPAHVRTFAYEKNENEFWGLSRDQFFVMGDNRGDSCDSRSFGAIRRDQIVGRVIH